MEEQEIIDKLIDTGVTVLKEYGYPEVTKDNILTDKVYKAFYVEILKQNSGMNDNIDKAIQSIFQKMESGGISVC